MAIKSIKMKLETIKRNDVEGKIVRGAMSPFPNFLHGSGEIHVWSTGDMGLSEYCSKMLSKCIKSAAFGVEEGTGR